MANRMLEAGLSHYAEGRPGIAVAKNKKPYRKWKHLFTHPQTEDSMRQQFANGAYGIAVVLYPACPYMVLDFDGPHSETAWQLTNIALAERARNRTQSGGHCV